MTICYKLIISIISQCLVLNSFETNKPSDMKIIKLKDFCELRILGLNAFVEAFDGSNKEKEQIIRNNLPCMTTRENGNLVVYTRNDVFGPAAEFYYDRLYEDLRAEGFNRDAIENLWKQISPEILGM